MKVLILTITAGQGHNSCAKTISEVFTSMGVENRVLDTYGYVSKPLYEAFSEGYLLVVKSKRIYGTSYELLEKRKPHEHSSMRATNRLLSKKLLRYIQDYKPDAIVYTHVMVGFILDILKEDGELCCKTYGIVTDFTMHPYWDECLRTDYIVLPNHLIVNKAVEEGFSRDQILTTGIPISEKFMEYNCKREARSQLELDPEQNTVLLMGGSMGYGNISEVVEELDECPMDFQIISVCGNNAQAKETIDKMKLSKPIRNYGFTDNINLLMDASDCIITKPGGLTSSEALAKRIPIIISNPIPGQEERNTEFLMNSGVAMKASEFQSISELLFELFTSSSRIKGMESAMDEIRRPRATRDLCETVVEHHGVI